MRIYSRLHHCVEGLYGEDGVSPYDRLGAHRHGGWGILIRLRARPAGHLDGIVQGNIEEHVVAADNACDLAGAVELYHNALVEVLFEFGDRDHERGCLFLVVLWGRGLVDVLY